MLKQIGALEITHKKSQAEAIGQELESLGENLNLLLIDKVKGKLTLGKWMFYEFGNKPGRMLANALKEKKAQSQIKQIKTQKDGMINTPQKIAQAFKKYYESLYQLEGKPTPEKPKKKWEESMRYTVLEKQMPRLSEDIIRELDVPISIEEFNHLSSAHRQMTAGRGLHYPDITSYDVMSL